MKLSCFTDVSEHTGTILYGVRTFSELFLNIRNDMRGE